MSFKGFWCEASLSKDDAGEIILLIKNKSGMLTKDIAGSIDVSVRDFTMAENGKGAHVFSILDKLCNKFNLETKLSIKGL